MQVVTNLLEVKHSTTSVGNPKSDGLLERLNHTIKTSLASYVETDLIMREEKLPFVTFAYNTAVQASTGKSPIEVLFGRKPVIPTTALITFRPKTTNGNVYYRYLKTIFQSYKNKLYRH